MISIDAFQDELEKIALSGTLVGNAMGERALQHGAGEAIRRMGAVMPRPPLTSKGVVSMGAAAAEKMPKRTMALGSRWAARNPDKIGDFAHAAGNRLGGRFINHSFR